MKPVIFEQKNFLAMSIGALSLLLVCFVAFDRYTLEVAAGTYRQWIMAIYSLLMVYFVIAIVRAILMVKNIRQKHYYIASIMVSFMALFTFLIDKITLDEIAHLFTEGFGFSGEQRMLLVSLLVKFIALIVSALAALRYDR